MTKCNVFLPGMVCKSMSRQKQMVSGRKGDSGDNKNIQAAQSR